MARVRVFHWKAEEAKPLLTVLEAAGHSVEYSDQFGSARDLRHQPPDAIVIDLSRLPSHGRELAVYLRGSKATRHVPIVFVGGEPEKIENVRRVLPDAAFTPASRLRSTLRTAIANPPTATVKPPQAMERWAHRTTAQKLGITKSIRAAVIDPPGDYAKAIGPIPEGASFEEDPT